MQQPVYLDYNATTPVDPEVLDEMLPFLKDWHGNPFSSYALGQKSKAAVEKARKQVAELINAEQEEIVFTSGGTESDNFAILGVAMANQDKGKHIITSAIEHSAVINTCKHLASLGWEITYVPVDSKGLIDPKEVEKSIREDTVLISIMHANNEVGSIQPIDEIGIIANDHNVIFHTDAAQSAGKIRIDVENAGLDLLTLAGHKLYAPKGIGALYIKKGTQIANLMYGAGQEGGLRPGTENVPYIVALGKACEIAVRDFAENVRNMLDMKNKLRDGLKERSKDKIHITGPKNKCLPNTLSIAFLGKASHDLLNEINDEVNISAGSACHANSVEISSVLKAMQVDLEIAKSTVRISTGKHTTEEEINTAIEIFSKKLLDN